MKQDRIDEIQYCEDCANCKKHWLFRQMWFAKCLVYFKTPRRSHYEKPINLDCEGVRLSFEKGDTCSKFKPKE